MLENIVIFSKESKDVVLTAMYGELDPTTDTFADSLEKILEIAVKLDKGVFILDLDNNFIALILAIKDLSVSLVFNEEYEKKNQESWEKIAKEIINGFAKVFEIKSVSKYLEYKEKIDEIIEWHKKELSPLDKMKDALW
ncbi:MAG: hypothetical protein HZR80_19780 [Candidatus Heimdallarchaeota archaeon]